MEFNLDFIYGHLPYWLFIILMLSGLFIVVSRGNLIKKIVGLNIFQTSVFMFYISIGKMKVVRPRFYLIRQLIIQK